MAGEGCDARDGFGAESDEGLMAAGAAAVEVEGPALPYAPVPCEGDGRVRWRAQDEAQGGAQRSCGRRGSAPCEGLRVQGEIAGGGAQGASLKTTDPRSPGYPVPG